MHHNTIMHNLSALVNHCCQLSVCVCVCVCACVCVTCHFLLISNIHNKHIAYHNGILSVQEYIPNLGLVAIFHIASFPAPPSQSEGLGTTLAFTLTIIYRGPRGLRPIVAKPYSIRVSNNTLTHHKI